MLSSLLMLAAVAVLPAAVICDASLLLVEPAAHTVDLGARVAAFAMVVGRLIEVLIGFTIVAV